MPAAAEIDQRESADSAVVSLREDAVRHVADELTRRPAAARRLPDASARFNTLEDLRHHVDFLGAALATGMPEAFTDYVRWAASVMDSRGVSLQTLDVSLERLGAFFAGHLPREHRDTVAKVIDQGRKALAAAPCAGAPAYGVPHPQATAEVPNLVRCLLAGDVAASRALAFRAWEREGDYVRVATRLFQPALYDTGLLWQRNQVTVAQEHLASAICQTLLTQLFLTAALFVKPNGRSAVFAAVEGDRHALGLRIVADAFELAGWSVQHLGADTPTESLVAHIGAVRPDVVGVSASLAQHLPTLRRVVERLRADLGSQCPKILVGGLPLNQMENAWRWIGADAWSPDAESAVAAVG